MKVRAPAFVPALAATLASCAPQQPASSAGPAPAAASASISVPTATVPPKVKGQNPFASVKFYKNEYNPATQQARAWDASRPADAKLLDKIGNQPVGKWVGEWSGDVETTAHTLGAGTNNDGTVAIVVLYNIPNRDCGQYSAGGSKSNDAYRAWIRQFAKGAAGYRIIVVLEPDALGLLTQCLSPADQQARLATLKDAVDVLEATPGVSVYIDAGNAKWAPPDEMAKRLIGAGVADADGFALNVSNYIATDVTVAYGRAISAATGGKHFIVDTGRNGNGAVENDPKGWCNPEGRALGSPPTTDTGDPAVDAFFWIKPPGESDGECRGGPKAGQFWPDQALGLAKRAKW
jgi:endoglucanase